MSTTMGTTRRFTSWECIDTNLLVNLDEFHIDKNSVVKAWENDIEYHRNNDQFAQLLLKMQAMYCEIHAVVEAHLAKGRRQDKSAEQLDSFVRDRLKLTIRLAMVGLQEQKRLNREWYVRDKIIFTQKLAQEMGVDVSAISRLIKNAHKYEKIEQVPKDLS